MKERPPTEEEYLEWLSNPVTQVYRLYLRAYREALKEQWARGQFSETTIEGTALADAAVRGEVASLDRLMSLEFEQLIEGIDDE